MSHLGSPSKRIRVVIADDHPVVRKGLRLTLEEFGAEIELVGEAADGIAVVRLVEEVQPDVVLMDIRMPGMDGLEALEHLRASSPQVAVVILTTYNEDALLLRGLHAGACGYLLKDCPLDTLLHAIHAAASGETLLQPEMVARLLIRAQSVPTSYSAATMPLANVPRFTDRDLEILAAIARGERSKEIAARLGLTRRTVETYLTNIYLKLDVDSRAAAVAVALEQGLLRSKESQP
jgi:two-component system, NarL family, response regulator YdfI